MAKLSKISIKNFRGAKNQVDLSPLAGQSVLLYGDNGTGKSSFADAVEWSFTDKIAHLRGDGIETHGGVKNFLSDEKEESVVELTFASPKGTAKKSLLTEKEKLKILPNFSDDTIKGLCVKLEKDRVLLRNSELVSFILAAKNDRLLEISSIIGFEQVTQVKAHLKKVFGDLDRTIKNKGFESLITKQKNLVTQQLGETIHTDEQFFNACNGLIAPLNLGTNIQTWSDIEKVEIQLKLGVDPKALEEVRTLDSIQSKYETLLSSLEELKSQQDTFWVARDKLMSDLSRLKKITLSKLLDEATKVLATHDKDDCPLCLNLVSREELKASIKNRIDELKGLRDELDSAEALKTKLISSLSSLVTMIDAFCADSKCLNDATLLDPILKFNQHLKDTSKNISSKTLTDISDKIDWSLGGETPASVNAVREKAAAMNKETKAVLNSPKVEIASKLAVAKTAYSGMIHLQKEESVLSGQLETMEKVVSKFNADQKNGMDTFLGAISDDMNKLFKFMSSDEKVEDVKLTTLVDPKTQEFDGIAVSIKFHGQTISAPKKYLSESKLNCLGLCLFLSSIMRFNKHAKFFVLDDVISSFDKSHRIRFGQLLHEKFSDYQIFVLTHETEWFDFLSSVVKSAGWLIQKTKWVDGVGTSLELPASSLKEQIEAKISASQEDDLSNLIRRYGERVLKDICIETDTPLAFRSNERNESRMFDELYSGVRGRVSAKSPELAKNEKIGRLGACLFLTNKGSHDNLYNPNLDDLKAGYKDLIDFESLFRCAECSALASLKFANIPDKNISCKCGKHKINWKH